MARQRVSHQRERPTRQRVGSRAKWGQRAIGSKRGQSRAAEGDRGRWGEWPITSAGWMARIRTGRGTDRSALGRGGGPPWVELAGRVRDLRGTGHRRRPGIAPRRGAVGSRPSIPARLSGSCGRAVGQASGTRRDGRAVEGARLESVCRATYRGFESHSLRHSVCVSGDRGLQGALSPEITRDYAGFWAIGSTRSEPETAESGRQGRRTPSLSPEPIWMVGWVVGSEPPKREIEFYLLRKLACVSMPAGPRARCNRK